MSVELTYSNDNGDWLLKLYNIPVLYELYSVLRATLMNDINDAINTHSVFLIKHANDISDINDTLETLALQSDLTDAVGRVATNETDIETLQGNILTINNTYADQATQISTNATNITTNANNIKTNEDNIKDLREVVFPLGWNTTSSIYTLQQKLNEDYSKVSSLQSTLATNLTSAQDNITLLSTNKLDIDQGTSNANKFIVTNSEGKIIVGNNVFTTDTTLTLNDNAADSKTVGDKIALINTTITTKLSELNSTISSNKSLLETSISTAKSLLLTSIATKVTTAQGLSNASKFVVTDGSGNIVVGDDISTKLDTNQGTDNADKIMQINSDGDIKPSDVLNTKVNVNQGTLNAGQALIINLEGNVVPGEAGVAVDLTFTLAGKAADAQATGELLAKKVDINQGISNSGKALIIDSSGNVTIGSAADPRAFIGVTYDKDADKYYFVTSGTTDSTGAAIAKTLLPQKDVNFASADLTSNPSITSINSNAFFGVKLHSKSEDVLGDLDYYYFVDAQGDRIKDADVIKGIGTGGSGTGGTGASTSVTITNETYVGTTKTLNQTVAYGNTATFDFSYVNSSEDQNGTMVFTINGSEVSPAVYDYDNYRGDSKSKLQTSSIAVGKYTVDPTEFLVQGTNTIRLRITDANGAYDTKIWTIVCVSLSVNATLDELTIYYTTNAIRIAYTPIGSGLTKTTHFLVDGVLVTSAATTLSGSQSYQSVTITEHGAHYIDLYCTAPVSNATIQSNTVHFGIIVADPSSVVPIIALRELTNEATLYTTSNILYMVYQLDKDSVSLTETIQKPADDDGVRLTSTQSLTVSRTTQTLSLKPYLVGTYTITLSVPYTTADGASATYEKTFDVVSNNLLYDIHQITDNLLFDFNPTGRSNSSTDKETWTSYGISLTVNSNFDWQNGGYQTDDDGNTMFVVKAGDRATVHYDMFKNNNNLSNDGANIKFIYKAVNCRAFDAVVMSDMALGVGVNVNAKQVTFSTKDTSIYQYVCLDEYTLLLFNLKNRTDGKLMFINLQGIPSRFAIYQDVANLMHTDAVLAPFVIGSDNCDVCMYRFKAYSCAFSDKDTVDSFIADAPDGLTMVERYKRNDILNQDGDDIDPDKLALTMPGLRVIKITCNRFTHDKDDKVKGCTVLQIMYGGRLEDNWTALNVIIKGQGTSSNAYGTSARNLDIDCVADDDGYSFWYYHTDDEGIKTKTMMKKYAMTDDCIALKYFNIKLNVASSLNMNNALLQQLYHEYQPYLRQARIDDSKVRDTMQFFPCAIFVQCSYSDNKALPYTTKDKMLFYGVGDFGNSKKNVKAQGLDCLTNPNECVILLCNNTDPLVRFKSYLGALNQVVWLDDNHPLTPFSFRYSAPDKLYDADYYTIQNGLYVEYDALNVTTYYVLVNNYVYVPYADIDNYSTFYVYKTNSSGSYEYVQIEKDLLTSSDSIYVQLLQYTEVTRDWLSTNASTYTGFYYKIDSSSGADEYVLVNYETVSASMTYYTAALVIAIKEAPIKAAWMETVKWVNSTDATAATNAALSSSVTYNGTVYTTDSAEYRLAKFTNEFDNHFQSDSLMYHYCFVSYFEMVDNRAKNTFAHCVNPLASNAKWDFVFDYDNDTAMGINNLGDLALDFGMEDVDDYDNGTSIFNAKDSVLWTNVRLCFSDRINKMFNDSSLYDLWNESTFIARCKLYQSYRPLRLLVADIKRKYIRPYEDLNDTLYVDMLNGTKLLQRKYFIKYQSAYMASKFHTSVATNDQIVLRTFSPGTTADDYTGDTTGGGADASTLPTNYPLCLKITPYADVYVYVRFGGTDVSKRCKRGLEFVIQDLSQSFNDTETYIYSASMLEVIDGLLTLFTNQITVASAKKLRKLVLGSSNSDYRNPMLTSTTSLNLSTLYNLLEVLIDNCPKLTCAIDVSGCTALKKISCTGTPVSTISFPNGGTVKLVYMESATTLTLRNLKHILTFEVADDYASLLSLYHENTTYPTAKYIVEKATNLNRARLVGIDWSLNVDPLSDTTILNRLYKMSGFSLSGDVSGQDSSILIGLAYISGSIRQTLLLDYNAKWPSFEITYSSTSYIPQYLVHIVNDDGSTLLDMYVDRGSLINEDDMPTAKKLKDAEYTYTFKLWVFNDGSAIDFSTYQVFNSITLYASYTETIRTYTVKWYNDYNNVVLQLSTVTYGQSAIYTGDTPTRTDGNTSGVFRLFNGWKLHTGFVSQDLNVYPNWLLCNGLPALGTSISDMNAALIYAIVDRGKYTNYISSSTDTLNITHGYNPTYENVKETIVAQNLLLDGLNLIIEDVKLFDSDKSWTMLVLFSYDISADSSDGIPTIVSCMNPDTNQGFKIIYSSHCPQIKLHDGANLVVGYQSFRAAVAIRHKKGDKNLYAYSFDKSSSYAYSLSIGLYYSDYKTSIVYNDTKLMFGADYGTGIKTGYTKGTIHLCKIWYDDLGANECKLLVRWTHETTSYRVRNGNNTYLKNDNSGYASLAFVLLALCEKSYYMNSDSSNSGGWKTSLMRTFANNRLFKSLPNVWQQIVKKVYVKSMIGNSTTITTSLDYMYLPCRSLVDGSQSSPYIELTSSNSVAGRIPWLTNYISRLRWNNIVTGIKILVDYTDNTDPTANASNTVALNSLWYSTNTNNNTYKSGYKILVKRSKIKPNMLYFNSSYDDYVWVLPSYWMTRTPYESSSTGWYIVNQNGTLAQYPCQPTSYESRNGIYRCFSV